MAIVNTEIPITSALNEKYILELVKKYPFLRTEKLGQTAFGRPIRTLVVGTGPRKVIFTAAHHGNEWITAPVLLKYGEELAETMESGGSIGGADARDLASRVTIYMVPLVNPDGVDLVNGAVTAEELAEARKIAAFYPRIPFPDGWKANLKGVDLNLNYPAGWLQAREIKFGKGYTRPAPRDYVGRFPLSQPETKKLAGYTEFIRPDLILAYHSQGKEIYWQFEDIFVEGARELGEKMAEVSGYNLAEVPYDSGFAGYKDWFIKTFRRPGYTIEVGQGDNPLPISQFPEIYRDNVGLMTAAALGE